jgi:hypothetical protein
MEKLQEFELKIFERKNKEPDQKKEKIKAEQDRLYYNMLIGRKPNGKEKK